MRHDIWGLNWPLLLSSKLSLLKCSFHVPQSVA